MDLMTLRYFQYVAMYRNFSKAAAHFYMGQPTLSRQIASLEKDLGVRLLKRDTRHVTLTDAGRVLYESADLLLRHAAAVNDALEAARAGRTGELGIAMVEDFGTAVIDIVQRFHRAYPKVKLRIDDIPFDQLADSILQGVYDMAVTLDFAAPKDDRLRQQPIGHDHLVAVMSDNYPYSGADPMPLAELGRVLLLRPNHIPPRFLRAVFLSAGPHSIESVPNTVTTLLRVQLGLGVAIVPKLVIESSHNCSHLRFCELDQVDTRFSIIALYRRDNAKQTLANFLSFADARPPSPGQ